MHFSFEKYVPYQVLKDFSVENLETTHSTFLSKFSSEILSRIVNYWGSIFSLYLTWGPFSLVCVLSVFFFLSFFFFFLFLLVFSLTNTNDSKDSKEGRRNHYFSCISLPPAHKHAFSSSRFLPLVFNYQTDSWSDLLSLEIWILFAFSLMQLSIDFDSSKWHCEDLNSYQTNTFILQIKRLNRLILTPVTTTVHLPGLPSSTPNHHLSSIRLPNCIMRDFF